MYEPCIKYDATAGLHKKVEREWTAWFATQSLIQAYEIGCQYFILKFVEDTWVRRLQDLESLYIRVALRYLLDLLSTHSGGLKRSKVIAMFAIIHLWWTEDPSVPKFINIFDNT